MRILFWRGRRPRAAVRQAQVDDAARRVWRSRQQALCRRNARWN